MIDLNALKRGAAKTPPRAEPQSELDGVAGLVSQALELVRMLPLADLERERFRGYIYNLLYQAQLLIITDRHGGGTDEQISPSPLGDDLNSILGG